MLYDEMLQNGGKRMGSTLAALYVDNGKAVVCNIGDSRIYRIKDGILQQLSKAHTIVQQMVDMGDITKEEARINKKRHVLSQNIGIFPEEMVIEPFFSEPIVLEAGETFLLCSDGLTDEEINNILSTDNIHEQAERLIGQALENGGRDNVTVLLVKVGQIPFL